MARRRCTAGHWVTVGGRPDPATGRKHVGGIPVFICEGRVLHHHTPRYYRGEHIATIRRRAARSAEERAKLEEYLSAMREIEEWLEGLRAQAKNVARVRQREDRELDPYLRLLREARRVLGPRMIRADKTEETRWGLPRAWKTRHGVPLDEAAQALGFSGGEALREAIRQAERFHREIQAKRLEDYEREALEEIEASDEFVSGQVVLGELRKQVRGLRPKAKARPRRRRRRRAA